jgi:hypothetical protein
LPPRAVGRRVAAARNERRRIETPWAGGRPSLWLRSAFVSPGLDTRRRELVPRSRALLDLLGGGPEHADEREQGMVRKAAAEK